MQLVAAILIFALRIYSFLLIVRFITEMIQSFSRSFAPPRWFVMIAEPIFVLTDPPVKALRRLIPPLRAGGVGLDISVLLLFFLISVLDNLLLQVLL